MKSVLLFCLLFTLCFTSMVSAQDIIKKNNGDLIEAKNISIDGDILYYQKYHIQSEFEFSIRVEHLEYIQFENGRKLNFKRKTPDSIPLQKNVVDSIPKLKLNNSLEHLILFNATGLFSLSLGAAYEVDFLKNKISIRSHINISPSKFGEPKAGVNNFNTNIFSAGSNLHFNLGKKGKKGKYFIGPSLRGGYKLTDLVLASTGSSHSTYAGVYVSQGSTWKYNNGFILSLELAFGRNIYFDLLLQDILNPYDAYLRVYLGFKAK